MSGQYPPDLARIHTESYADTFATAFDWLSREIKDAPAQARLFDLGCGDGAWLAAAADRGIPGSGIDLSAAFVELARGRGLEVATGRAAEAQIPAGTSAITALGEVLSYVDTASGQDSLEPVARAALDHLPSGGRLFADMIGTGVVPFSGQRKGPDWSIRSEVTITATRLTRRMETEYHGNFEVVTHHQTRRAPEPTADMLRDMGWICDLATGYGPCPLLQGRFAIVLTRP
ncbi:class I SAM-dependent methyltransferase [Primorskyibacter sp. S87]|uniref:class I SAM-dependent methyltransferase n=1 Tax=Primorskyibacter sp. S87 TaxID=3415126 RepID=UPI003C7B7457